MSELRAGRRLIRIGAPVRDAWEVGEIDVPPGGEREVLLTLMGCCAAQHLEQAGADTIEVWDETNDPGQKTPRLLWVRLGWQDRAAYEPLCRLPAMAVVGRGWNGRHAGQGGTMDVSTPDNWRRFQRHLQRVATTRGKGQYAPDLVAMVEASAIDYLETCVREQQPNAEAAARAIARHRDATASLAS